MDLLGFNLLAVTYQPALSQPEINQTANRYTLDVRISKVAWLQEKCIHRTTACTSHLVVPSTASSNMKCSSVNKDVGTTHSGDIQWNINAVIIIFSISHLDSHLRLQSTSWRCCFGRQWRRWVSHLRWTCLPWRRSTTGQGDAQQTSGLYCL